ncbi:uncharacterized protein ARMOST_18821 [Armillaria ostoyae]|uniref:Uncharacterized protein n=1 Tax=Armillaria ostoyae TaxID=47428 RepID=A0A284S2T7_ARMOS|nr:uncharacterized protein ARMOST_18821 [Armillaria ostoyae]
MEDQECRSIAIHYCLGGPFQLTELAKNHDIRIFVSIDPDRSGSLMTKSSSFTIVCNFKLSRSSYANSIVPFVPHIPQLMTTQADSPHASLDKHALSLVDFSRDHIIISLVNVKATPLASSRSRQGMPLTPSPLWDNGLVRDTLAFVEPFGTSARHPPSKYCPPDLDHYHVHLGTLPLPVHLPYSTHLPRLLCIYRISKVSTYSVA